MPAARSSTRRTGRSSPRSTSPPTPRSRPPSPPRGAPSTRPTGRAARRIERAALLDRVAGAHRPRPRGDGPARDAQHRQGHAREPLGHGRRRARLPLLRRPRRRRTRGALVDADNPDALEPDRLRAGRGLRRSSARGTTRSSRSAGRSRRRSPPGTRWSSKPAQVTPLTAIHLVRAARGGRVPAGVVNLVLGPGGRRRPGARRQPGRGPHLADRRPRGGPGADGGRRGQLQEGRPRDGRQEPEHRVRRRRLRDRRRQRGDRRVHPFRAGLLGRVTGDRPGHDLRTLRGRGRPARGRDPARPRDGRRDRDRGAHHAPTTGPRSRRSSPGAIADGARLVAGGRRPTEPELQAGFFYRPTVFADVRPDMRIVREEVFGPVLTIERFTTEDEAIAMANDTTYGLAGAVWTADAGAGPARRVPSPARDDLDQRLQHVSAAGRVGRLQAVGHRPRAGPDRPRRVPRGQAHLAEHRPGPTGWFGG